MQELKHSPERSSGAVGVLEPTVSIVLVCWNSRRDIEVCLNRLFVERPRCSFEVIVVDNDSTDGSQALLRDSFPEVQLIELGSNAGFAAACNAGVRIARGPYLLLLNNDTLPDGAAIDRMVRFLEEHGKAGVSGGRLLNADGSFQAGFSRFSNLREELLIATGLGRQFWPGFPSHHDSKAPTQADWISAACLMIRRSAYLAVGGMDETYFMYSEEVDLQFRLKREGWEIYYIPEAETIHYGGRSQDRWRRRRMVYRGKVLFYRKNYGRIQEFCLRSLLGVVAAVKLAAWFCSRLIRPSLPQATNEIRSNFEVIRLCLNPHG